MDWVYDFYTKQEAWSGVATEDINDQHKEKAASITEFVGEDPKRVLELGAGGGQVAAVMADLGHDVVAIELTELRANHAKKLAEVPRTGTMTVIQDDFYTADVGGPFDVVCYWDGFGIGTDADQRRLLKRVASWLTPEGSALFDVGTPWYPAAQHGRGWTVGDAERQYTFDGDGCRWEDTWWPIGEPEKAVKQSTRSYSPADLRLLVAPTGLVVKRIKPGGTMDWEEGKWLPSVPIGKAMFYVAEMGLVS